MVRSGDETREKIIRQAAALFNTQGFAGASMSDIMAATGLQKGGIYRHFESKEQLALESFDYAVAIMGDRFREALEGKRDALSRLHAIISVFARIPHDPPVPGGCPVMNAALENDDGNPVLRDRARDAMDGLRALVVRVAKGGLERGEVRPGTDPDALASVLISTLEGAVMLSKLYDDPEHVRRAVAHMERYLDESVRAA
ncbi:MAG: TetR/AcrR family transcriptional regulator [Gemmatimonadetes bacterium]|nr:TetR/AcrR family transcriptional regulator [Gemmatimonadota bacterium]